MVTSSIDEDYFLWLMPQVITVDSLVPHRSYFKTLQMLYRTEFVVTISNDENRAEDGKQLRMEFIEQTRRRHIPPGWLSLDCSVLEMMIALCRHMVFEAERDVAAWFWELMHNLSLDGFVDAYFNEAQIGFILDMLNRRFYRQDGIGGLYPLFEPEKDQRHVELWYQMNAYLLQSH